MGAVGESSINPSSSPNSSTASTNIASMPCRVTAQVKRLRLCKTDLAPRKSARSIVGECLANEVLAPPIPIAAPIAGSAPISGTVAVWGR